MLIRVVALLIVIGLAFYVFYRIYLSPRAQKQAVIEILRKNGIGDKPESVVKNYHLHCMNQKLTEQAVRKLTREYRNNNPEFFLTMYLNTQSELKKKKEPEK